MPEHEPCVSSLLVAWQIKPEPEIRLRSAPRMFNSLGPEGFDRADNEDGAFRL